MGSARWTAELSLWPVGLISLGPGDKPADFDSLLAAGDEVLAQGCRYVVLDLTRAEPDAERRRRVGGWLDKNREAIEATVEALAIVAPSALQRGAVKAVQWLIAKRFGVALEIVKERDAAFAWVSEQRRQRS